MSEGRPVWTDLRVHTLSLLPHRLAFAHNGLAFLLGLVDGLVDNFLKGKSAKTQLEIVNFLLRELLLLSPYLFTKKGCPILRRFNVQGTVSPNLKFLQTNVPTLYHLKGIQGPISPRFQLKLYRHHGSLAILIVSYMLPCQIFHLDYSLMFSDEFLSTKLLVGVV